MLTKNVLIFALDVNNRLFSAKAHGNVRTLHTKFSVQIVLLRQLYTIALKLCFVKKSQNISL